MQSLWLKQTMRLAQNLAQLRVDWLRLKEKRDPCQPRVQKSSRSDIVSLGVVSGACWWLIDIELDLKGKNWEELRVKKIATHDCDGRETWKIVNKPKISLKITQIWLEIA